MTTRHFIRGAAALAVGAGLALGQSAAAFAATTTTPSPTPAITLTDLRTKCDTAITARLSFLGDLAGRVASDTAISPTHRADLNAIIGADRTGLGALETTINADTTLSAMRADCEKIVTAYRVYLLVGPQVHLVAGADRVDAVDDRLQALLPTLRAAVAKCSVPLTECQAAERALDDIQSKVTQSRQDVAGVAALVLSLTPSEYPEFITSLKAAASSLSTARTALDGVRSDLATVKQALGATAPRPTPLASPEA